MGILYTTNYHVPYMDPATPFADVQVVTQQLAQLLDAAMGKAGYTPPDATTFADLSARQAPSLFLAAQTGTGQSMAPNAWTNVPLVSRTINGAGSSTSDRFTASSAGLYEVQGFASFVGSVAMVRIAARVVLTAAVGGVVSYPNPGSAISAAPAAVDLGVTTPMYYLQLAVGDQLRLEGYHQGSAAVNLRAAGGPAQLAVRQLTRTS